MGQINIKASTTHQPPPSGKLGYGFDDAGNPVKIESDGSSTPIGTGGVIANVIANKGVGPESGLPGSGFLAGDVFVSNDTYKIFTAVDTTSWNSVALQKSQIVTDTLYANKITYQYNGSSLLLISTGGIHRPASEPIIVTGTPNTLPIDFQNSYEAIIEPKKTSGSRTIDVDFTISFSNDSNLTEGILRPQLSGTRVITFPSNVKCSVDGGYTWNDVAHTLTIPAGTNEIFNMSLEKDRQGGFYDLIVGGVPV